MARGSQAKLEITKKLLEVFPNSFMYNEGKEIRIPVIENGEVIQIKITLTAAKTNVDIGGDTAVPGSTTPSVKATVSQPSGEVIEPTAEEKENVANLLASLGL